jgi:hypothetical protein
MAQEHRPVGDHSSGGSMDIADLMKTRLAFWSGGKWAVIIQVILAALPFFFRTHNG